MKLYFAVQIALTLLASLVIAEFRDAPSAASFAVGSGLITMNVAALSFVWFHVIHKKLVALSFLIIVFKYAILGIIIYKVLGLPWLQKSWLCVGLGSLLISTLTYGLISSKKETGNGN